MFFRNRRSKGRITIRSLVYIGWTTSSMTVLAIFLVLIHSHPEYIKRTGEISSPLLISEGSSSDDRIPRILSHGSLSVKNSKMNELVAGNLRNDFAGGNRAILEQRAVVGIHSHGDLFRDGSLDDEYGVAVTSDNGSKERREDKRLDMDEGGIPEDFERRISARISNGLPVVDDGIFWSMEAENLVPRGLTNEESERRFRNSLSVMSVRSMEAPQWNRCGRPKNQFLTLDDGTTLCARYRHPQETLIRGEVLSYYLSKFLAFDNVPPVVLSRLSFGDTLWRKQNFTASADWVQRSFIALIQWIDDLNHERSRVKMPHLLLSLYESGVTMTAEHLNGAQLDSHQLTSLVQWTDLVIFDYITGHYDRVASMQDGAAREMRPGVMAESIRNLRQVLGTGKLVLIDNESGFFDGYELMYRGAQTGIQFLGFHRRLLKAICVFRRRTVARVRSLAESAHPDTVLEEYAATLEPLYREFRTTPEVELFRTKFRERLKEVVDWVDHCAALSHAYLDLWVDLP